MEAPSTRHRVFVAEAAEGGELSLAGDAVHRITRVLRLPVGASIEVFDGRGRSWPATVAAVGARAVRLTIAEPRHSTAEPVTVLLAALIRPNRFEWLIEKATELGASAIQPVICTRGVVRPAEIGASRLERWRRIAIEAAEQCGRATVPDLRPPASLAGVLESAVRRLIVAAEPAHGATPPLGSLLRGIENEPVTLLTGPEGGLTPEEIAAATAAGGQPASLGPLVLRAETAAIAALAVLADARQ